ncbi:hypothetical protein ACPFP2_04235 [Micromonospora citrea]|uniref:hypothetical protein n=1 Tax=Micromonospora citrea TaxID=47855 RepID=UPI003C4517BF
MSLEMKMINDRWQRDYVTELLTHIIQMQHAGLDALLTQTLVQEPNDAYLLKTAAGRPFGSLRGPGSAIAAYENYVSQTFGDDAHTIIELVVAYASGVQDSSWAPMVQIVKEFLVRQRTRPGPEAYFWKQISDNAKSWAEAKNDISQLRMQRLGLPPAGDTARQELNLRRAVVSWHAFTQLLLRHTAFPANNQNDETLTVVRTESASALAHFKRQNTGAALTTEEIANPSTVYDVPLIAMRGALESSSLYTIKTIHGNVVTESVVPHHRIFALYLTGRPRSVEHRMSFFGNETENEVTFMPEGLPFRIRKESDLSFVKPTSTELTW